MSDNTRRSSISIGSLVGKDNVAVVGLVGKW